MKEIHLKGLNEVVYEDTCENGLKIYVWVNKKVNTFKGAYVIKCGAENVKFKVKTQEYQVPHGTAHYLEHMMCKTADGESLLGLFNELGSYSNAATYPDKTVYEFVGTTNLKENLQLLLDSIQTKKISPKAFENERGAILEEARMRKDDISRITTYGINKCLFWEYPNRVSGLGDIKDIENMKIESLELLYDTFYHPENSFVIVTGNVDYEEVIELIKENQKSKEFAPFIHPEEITYNEKDSIKKEIEKVTANVEIPQVYLNVKINKNNFKDIDELLLQDIIGVTLASNFGTTSLFREKVFEENLATMLSSMCYLEKDYVIIQIMAQTKYQEKLIPLLKEKLNNLEINEKDIGRKVKSEIANLVLGYEDPENVSDMLTYFIVKYGHILDNEKEILENIKLKEIEKVFKNFSVSQMNTFIVNPKKSES